MGSAMGTTEEERRKTLVLPEGLTSSCRDSPRICANPSLQIILGAYALFVMTLIINLVELSGGQHRLPAVSLKETANRYLPTDSLC